MEEIFLYEFNEYSSHFLTVLTRDMNVYPRISIAHALALV